jgi:hypothetical protein
MVVNKSLDEVNLIASLLQGIHRMHGEVFNIRALNLTLNKVRSRVDSEGKSFLTVALPRLGKAFDKALAASKPLNSVDLGFKAQDDSNLPLFMGEFFNRVLTPTGELLPSPCANSVSVLRQVLFVFYKYELPYTDQQEHEVLAKFEKTEAEITTHWDSSLQCCQAPITECNIPSSEETPFMDISGQERIINAARRLLKKVFCNFDPADIYPRHGPGAVATKQVLWEKFGWTNVCSRITDVYPFDAYFCASTGHVCDSFKDFESINGKDLPAKVILVPKDSRGPRLISCEPVDFQWVQQGLGRAMVKHVESHPTTKWNVHFTDQTPNRIGALYGSSNGRYATLDLNEASDRVSLDLVRLLFPEHVFTYLEACRSRSTVLPCGREITLRKYAPMGSALCFPVLALTTWALLTAIAPDVGTRESILVYGDDVIVPTAFAENAMNVLESFGLKINRDKSCTGGLFRESCGMDAFNGVSVTPVRIRTVWASDRRADVYTSWISYANSFFDRQYYEVYNLIVEELLAIYGEIPSIDMDCHVPALVVVPEHQKPHRKRWNSKLQKLEYRVWDIRSATVKKEIYGWSMLLRYFSESVGEPEDTDFADGDVRPVPIEELGPTFKVDMYTKRKSSMLLKRWR